MRFNVEKKIQEIINCLFRIKMPSDSEFAKFEFNSYIKSKANERFEIAIFIEFLKFFPTLPQISLWVLFWETEQL